MTLAFQRILCAVDFSDASREALRVATELTRKSQAVLVVLHVAERAAPWIEAELAAWQQASRRRGASEVGIKLRLGVAWDQIIGAARDDARIDLIVLGAHGRKRGAAIGTVAERVVRDPPCTVMVVAPRVREPIG
jgi:universal stress protein A